MQLLGIDVSHWQGNIDWAKVQASGIQFAILKAGGSDSGRYKDRDFEHNYAMCKALGIKAGCYYFHGKGCTSAVAGRTDAQHFLSLISGKVFEYPCYSDLEAPTSATKNGNTDAVIAFCEMVKSAGFKTGIYASDISGFKDRLDINRLGAYDKWVARYGSSPKYVKDYQVWQYGSNGKVNGINGRVDMNISYKDYGADAPVPAGYILNGLDYSPVFNPEFYADHNADVKAVFGYDNSALWEHFVVFGQYEGRQASAEFNPIVYKDRYADLRAVYGDNMPMYYLHYVAFGKAEGRTAI